MTTAKIADNAITNAKMADNAIGNAELADNAVNTAEIADNAITNAKMADNAIGGAEISDSYIVSGTYTATLTNVTNVAASTFHGAQYIRVGNVVTVGGAVSIDPTAASTQTELGISLPVASNFAVNDDCGGVASCTGTSNGSLGILGDATNDRARILGFVNHTANIAYGFTFTYEVI